MSEVSLKSQAFKGVFWTFLNKGGTMILSFVSNIVLARLLTPADFGIIGMVMVFVYISNSFMDSGFGSALIQRKNTTQSDFSTVFFWNLFFAIVLYLILYFSAPAIARFYEIEKLSSVLRVLGLLLIINALSLTQSTILRKNLDFKRITICFVSASLIALIAAIVSAYQGLGVWSIVIFQLTQAGFNTIFIWIVANWKPSLIFSFASFKDLFSFGGFIFISSLFNTLNTQAQALIIGKFFDVRNLGYYTQARNLEGVPTSVIYTVIGQVSYPLFAKLQDNRNELIQKFLRISSLVAFVIFPLMTILAILAQPIIVLMLSEKWIPSVPIFQILCITGFIIPLTDLTYFFVASIGRSKVLFYRAILISITGIVLLIGGSFIGLYATILGIVINTIFSLLTFAPILKKHFNLKFINYIKELSSPFLICLFSFILITIGNYLLLEELNIYLKAVIDLVIFGISFISLNTLFQVKNYIWARKEGIQTLKTCLLKKI